MPQPQVSAPGAHRYRADIDGLRALAVLPALFFHYRVPGFSGGFVGIEIFFVISGYLITQLLTGEMRAGRFSIAAFYERRVRRIFPALFVVLFVVSLAGAVILFPGALRTMGENVVAVALFAANFAFLDQTSYFDQSASLNPLLHTWSLAVEEQFYIVYPAVLYLVHRTWPARLTAVIGALALLSFLLTIYLAHAHPAAAFYLPFTRAWELLLGALVALGALPKLNARWLREVLAALGFAMIAGTIVFLPSNIPFLAATLIVTCLGTVLIIWADEAGMTMIGHGLSWRPVVFVGIISYSLYLWHWPIWSFTNYFLMETPGWGLRLGLFAISFALAVLSWWFIERPFRLNRHRFDRRTLFVIAGSAMAVCIGLGLAAFASNGFPERYPQQVRDVLRAVREFPMRTNCFEPSPDRAGKGQFCQFGDLKAAPSIALWGDSHALALFSAFDAVARRHGRKGLFMAKGDCPPFLGDIPLVNVPAACEKFNHRVMQKLAKMQIKTFILAGRWAMYDQGNFAEEDDLVPRNVAADRHALFAEMLHRTIDTLTQRGIKIILIEDVPEIGRSVPHMMARDMLMGWPEETGPTLAEYRARQVNVLAQFATLGAKVTLLDPTPILCPGGQCAIKRDGHLLYRDGDHLTTFGASLLEPMLDRAF
ncbi:MAG TPA: acyltransferase family protein [Rhizomicrobium sp.]|jgi:peptidoglycan/LPS O-acetylase OafA/YrhL|nr:acyltransferase family protein [Rhizomicrobium sp.]